MHTVLIEEKVLSIREFEVLKLVACGHKNCEIAVTLDIKERTVRFHVSNIFKKLNVRNRTQATCFALKMRWIIF